MNYQEWEFSQYCARIVGLSNFSESLDQYVRESYGISNLDRSNFKVICTSGGYDPIHPGHISNISDSAELGDIMVVIVNGDEFLKKKKGKPFQDLRTRCQIVSSLFAVDLVVPFEAKDDTVIEALKVIKPNIFTKGGDRKDAQSIPEWDICQELGIEIRTDIGMNKEWSSRDFLKDWEDFRKSSTNSPLKALS